LLVLMSVLALAAIVLSGLPLLLKGLAAPVLLLLALAALWRLHSGRITHIELEPDRLLLEQGGTKLAVTRFKALFLSAWYIGFVALDQRGRPAARVGLFREQFERESFRVLSTWFRDRS
jgi:hypothetical protein